MLSFQQWLEAINLDSRNVIIHKGEVLYHGTIESFDTRNIHVGGYDEIFWTTDDIRIARSYIPSKKSYYSIHLDLIADPRRSEEYDKLKESIGLSRNIIDAIYKKDREAFKVYLYWKDQHDYYRDLYNQNKDNLDFFDKENDFFEKWREAEDNFHKAKYYKTPEQSLKNFIKQKMKAFGYELKGSNFNHVIFDEDGNLLPANHKSVGSVLKIICNRDFVFYNYALGKEGDLMDLDYHKIDLFKEIESQTDASGDFVYDGIIINDFAQTDVYGNMNHVSFGFFQRSIKDLTVKKIRNQVHPGEEDWTSK